MPKVLVGKANEWAWEFYRKIEDYVYGVITKEDLEAWMRDTAMEHATREDLLDMMTNPPAIDYSED